MKAKPGGPGLDRSVGLAGVVMFGAGTAIGVSIFSVLQPAAQVAGSGLLVAIGVAAVPVILFGLCYAYLGSILPVSGASYEWPRRFLHPLAGFLVAWLRIFSSVGALVVLAQVLVDYAGKATSLPATPVMAAALTLVFALNYLGVVVAARAQAALMVLLLVVLALFVGSGFPLASATRIGSPFAGGLLPVAHAVPLMISLFLGIEAAVEIGEEVRDARRRIPVGIALAVLLTALVYGTVASTALGLVGPAGLAHSAAPLLDAAREPLGCWALPLIVGAATVSIVKTMNATALVFSRNLFAMGRSGVLPPALAHIHPRFRTPHIAIITAYVCAMAGLLMPSSLVFLLLAVNIPTMVKYLACSLCAARLPATHPALHDAAGLRLRPRTIRAIGHAAAGCALGVIAIGTGDDWRPYLLIGVWLLLGLAYWWLRGRRTAPI